MSDHQHNKNLTSSASPTSSDNLPDQAKILSSRRQFIWKWSLLAGGIFLNSSSVFARYHKACSGKFPFADQLKNGSLPGKHPEMLILNDRPVNAEAPPYLLDETLTSANRFFVRNNGIVPDRSVLDPAKWTLTIEGESVKNKKTFTLQELKTRFKQYTYALTLECGGNGRKEFDPPAKGNQWSLGAVGCAAWTGVRLADVLTAAGLKKDAVYIGYYGRDTHLSGDLQKTVISRGVPIEKALDEHSLIAWAMNGEDLPVLNGFPLRLVFGGWPASASGKWLSRIVVRNKVHDGPKMGGQSYRVPCRPVAPGTKVPDEEMCIIESMPVKSLITYPKSGAMIKEGRRLEIRGHAWAGELAVKALDYSIDFGGTWEACELTAPVNRLAWQHFSAKVSFPGKGYYEVWVRATDTEGRAQPMLLPGWNPRGYLNNACHRIAIKVT